MPLESSFPVRASVSDGLTRRRFLAASGVAVGAAALPVAGPVLAEETPAKPGGRPLGSRPDWATKPPAKRILRKSAEKMTKEEVDRFKRAFQFAVENGFMDAFTDEHRDHDRHRQHGAEVDAVTPTELLFMPQSWGYRLLPWHRSFILEGEMMLRAALRLMNKLKGLDPSEADLLFMPYWDVVPSQKLPEWIVDFKPKGGTAIVVPGLPKGHAAYGKEVGTRYNIEIGRWPGTYPGVELPAATSNDFRDMITRKEFTDFYAGLESEMKILADKRPRAEAALKVLEKKLAGDTSLATVKKLFEDGKPKTLEGLDAFFKALFKLAWKVSHTQDDKELVTAFNDVSYSVYWSPHARLHVWAGGVNPKNVDVRGTVSYFHEITVDPMFWLIHTALDGAWYAWEIRHPGKQPPLEGDDRIFNPLSTSEGAWYGGGRVYTLDDLTDHDKLPFTYAKAEGIP